MRRYRIDITTQGQSSSPSLNIDIKRIIKTHLNLNDDSIICDIGCGIGKHSELLKSEINCKYYGIDFSPKTIEYLKTKDIFDESILCSSDILPFPDKFCDVAISIENLEHLYEEQVVNALKELVRVSKYVIITTPRPDECMNLEWIPREMNEAENDKIPLTESDYICLESCVHKSIVFPRSMINCGFSAYWTGISMVYYGKSSEINLECLEYIGINSQQHNAKKYELLNDKYIALLNECLNINNRILKKYNSEI
jgi:SAM-dependent methyltransferase